LGLPDPDSSLFCTDPDPSSTSKKIKTSLVYYYFVTSFLLFNKLMEMYLQKINKQKNLGKKTIFLLASCQPLKKAGSRAGSESVNQWYGYPNPDPYQSVTDPQHSLFGSLALY
jgi:hypothetical protein